jgi:hypothetical protein
MKARRLGLCSALIWIALLVSGCGDRPRTAPVIEPRYIHADSVNIAVIVLDYDSLKFEGARVLYFPPCNPCADDSIPLSLEYRGPGDVGYLTVTYAPTGDLVFHGTLWWQGIGQIDYPASFDPPEHFDRSAGAVPLNANVRLLLTLGDAPMDSIWSKIASLDLVREFQSPSLRVGLCLYPNDYVAKWIVFLYRRA